MTMIDNEVIKLCNEAFADYYKTVDRLIKHTLEQDGCCVGAVHKFWNGCYARINEIKITKINFDKGEVYSVDVSINGTTCKPNGEPFKNGSKVHTNISVYKSLV